MPKCTINGKEVEVSEGKTIIQAMQENDLGIAHYCYHPGLSVAGVCRLCMIEIEGNPRPQIACNTVVVEGMKINNTSPKIKDTVKWALDFHLINHPLDCPICDQAGECGLQEQYMEYGKYDPEMSEKKVKKHKVVDLGPTVVLDSERCILCSRCVRFTEEVSKTNELGIFNRGDRSEIGTHDGKKLDNKYSLNTVDICPVGALTSKDFRFKQRVWYLKDNNTVCNGCSTGCNVKVYFNKEGLFRVKPVYNKEVNGYWMCDVGRDLYKFVNKQARLLKARKGTQELVPGAALKEAFMEIHKSGLSSAALVLTGQYTVEEYDAIVTNFISTYKSKNIFHWFNNKEQAESFDGILLRGDKNPNTKGLLEVLAKHDVKTNWSDLESQLASGAIKSLVVAAPENILGYTDMDKMIQLFGKAKILVWLSAVSNKSIDALTTTVWQIPMKSYIEKEGTFVNFAGLAQKFKKVTTVVSEALTLAEAGDLISGKEISIKMPIATVLEDAHRPKDRVLLEHRKKNEFVFKRGSL